MTQQRILVVDDNQVCLALSRKLLEKDPMLIVETATNGKECLEKLTQQRINLIVLDYLLPDTTGLELIKKIKAKGYDSLIIIVVSAENEDVAYKALEMGACNYLFKLTEQSCPPVLPIIIKRCLSNYHTIRKKKELEKNLQEDFINTISTLAALIELKDPYTGGHSRVVRDLSLAIGNKLNLPIEQLEKIEIAAFLHDIGKIGVPGKMLNKPDQLTPKEYSFIQKHVELAVLALKHVRKMEEVSLIIKHHHEAYDGHGYPDRLKGKKIPLGSRIIHIADAYSAMTSDRPYRPAMPTAEVIAELERGRGTDFDPELLAIFFQILWEHLEIVSKEKMVLEVSLQTYMN